MVPHGCQIGHRAGRLVVDNPDLVAPLQECLGQMRADKASSPGDENSTHYGSCDRCK